MGKRELLIIGAFLVLGFGAYQISAPPAAEGRGLSLSRILDSMRREVRGNPGTASWVVTGTIPVSADITELRIPSAPSGVTVTGEDREDVAYEMTVESNGPDDTLALEYAKAVSLKQDDLGAAIDIRLEYPDEASQRASLVMRVPSRLGVRVSGRSVQVVGVASAELNSVIGDATVGDISGLVSGTHRSGRLTVERAGRVDLTLQSSRGRFAAVRNGLVLSARNGDIEVEDSPGPIDIDQANVSVVLTGSTDRVRVGGTGGEVRVVGPRGDVQIETRRTEVEVALTHAVPLSVITTDDTLRLILAEGVAVVLEAAATAGGDVQATEFELTPEQDGDTSRLAHSFGTNASVRVVLRNSRGDIVIRRSR